MGWTGAMIIDIVDVNAEPRSLESQYSGHFDRQIETSYVHHSPALSVLKTALNCVTLW
jgi:hypothetical protein